VHWFSLTHRILTLARSGLATIHSTLDAGDRRGVACDSHNFLLWNQVNAPKTDCNFTELED
jgi:hypothetical protein